MTEMDVNGAHSAPVAETHPSRMHEYIQVTCYDDGPPARAVIEIQDHMRLLRSLRVLAAELDAEARPGTCDGAYSEAIARAIQHMNDYTELSGATCPTCTADWELFREGLLLTGEGTAIDYFFLDAIQHWVIRPFARDHLAMQVPEGRESTSILFRTGAVAPEWSTEDGRVTHTNRTAVAEGGS